MEEKSAPSVTRVHTLHRIRTVVNRVAYLVDKGIAVDDMAIADHLIETHLSKASIAKVRDQIGRRARDHLETARYLGLVYRKRTGSKFAHFPTEWGRALSKYKISQECPNDILEEAILVDRICRFKIANTSYLQEAGGTYANLRTRLCLAILASLDQSKELNLFQIAAILSDLSADLTEPQTKFPQTVKKVASAKWAKTYFEKLTPSHKRNVARDTMPFMDWCKQIGLIKENKETRTFVVTPRGKTVLDYYRASVPIWWADLGGWGDLAAAAVILINHLQLRHKAQLIKKLATVEARNGLFETGTIGSLIHEVTGLTIKQICDHGSWFDFSMSYDVPPERYELVQHQLDDLLSHIGMKSNPSRIIHDVEWASINTWLAKFKEEANESSQALSSRLNIKAILPTYSIQYQFQSDYEAATYVFLQQLQKDHFYVAKYQGQLVEYFADDPHWNRMARTNPDLLVTNGFLSLVECKSVKEWGSKLVPNKSIVAELMMYGQFVSALAKKTGPKVRCRAVISYEGEIETKHFKGIEDLLKTKCPDVIIVLRSALQKALVDPTAKNDLRGRMTAAPGFNDVKKLVVV